MGTPASVSYFYISSGFLLAYNYSELAIVLSSVLLFKWVETPVTSAMRRWLVQDRPQARLS